MQRGPQRRRLGNVAPCAEPFPVTGAIFKDSKFVSLDRAENIIRDFCRRVDGEDKLQCYSTLHDLREKHAALEAALKGDDAESAKKAEAELESLDAVARDLTALGSARKMVAGFVSIEADQRAAEDRAARAAAASSSDDSLIGDTTSEDASMRDQREAVFHDMDRNGDGFLNIGEFRAAMDSLGDHLDGATVAKICLALDIHGRMDFEDFHMIVDEEFMRSASKESLQLRHTLHKLSDSDFKHWLGSP